MGHTIEASEFPSLQKLPQYVFRHVAVLMEKARQEGRDIIDFSMGNPDGAPPRHLIEKLHGAIDVPQNHRYSVSRGITHLRQAICDWYGRGYGVTLDPETEAIACIGAKEGLSHLMLAVLQKDEAVLAPSPSYPIHLYAPIIAGGRVCPAPISPVSDFLKNIEDAIHCERAEGRPAPRYLIISFPHNPTTEIADLDFMHKVIALAREYRLFVIHDFAYADLAFDGYRPPSLLQVPGAKDIAVEFFSLSKSYNVAGWRLGFMVGNPKLVAALERLKSYLDYGIFQPLQIAALAALNGPQDCVHDIVENYRVRRDALCHGLTRVGWHVPPPKGTMFVWAQIPERFRRMGSLAFTKHLLDKAGVAVSPGIGFGEHGDGHVRFALIQDEQRTQKALEGIKTALAL